MKFPAYLIPHPDVVIWLVHQFRHAYDPPPIGWPASPSWTPSAPRSTAPMPPRFARADRIYTISPMIADRLRRSNGIDAPPCSDPAARRPAVPHGARGRHDRRPRPGRRQASASGSRSRRWPTPPRATGSSSPGAPETPRAARRDRAGHRAARPRGPGRARSPGSSPRRRSSTCSPAASASVYLPDRRGLVRLRLLRGRDVRASPRSPRPTPAARSPSSPREHRAGRRAGPRRPGGGVRRARAGPREGRGHGPARPRTRRCELDLSWDRVIAELTR